MRPKKSFVLPLLFLWDQRNPLYFHCYFCETKEILCTSIAIFVRPNKSFVPLLFLWDQINPLYFHCYFCETKEILCTSIAIFVRPKKSFVLPLLFLWDKINPLYFHCYFWNFLIKMCWWHWGAWSASQYKFTWTSYSTWQKYMEQLKYIVRQKKRQFVTYGISIEVGQLACMLGDVWKQAVGVLFKCICRFSSVVSVFSELYSCI